MLLRWAKDNRVILINAGSLIGTTAITSGLGFAYWWLAARSFSLEAVGFATAIVSAMALLGNFALLGMGTLLISELPNQRGKEISLISTALILVGGVGGCVGLVYAFTMSRFSSAFQILGASVGNSILFALGVSLTAITLVLDQALIGLLRGELQLWRNGIFAAVKLAALFAASLWLARATGLTIYATWVIGISASLIALVGFAVTRGGKQRRIYRLQWGWLRKLGLEALKHHLLNLALDVPSLLLPIIVTIVLSATVNAWFSVSWNLSGVANTASAAFATALYAVGAAQPSALARKMRLTLSLSLGVCLLANCVLLLAPAQILALFGHSYSDQAAWSLRILSLESFPFIIKNHYIALSRIHGRITHTILITTMTGILELSGAAIGAYLGGLNGLSLGWLVAMSIEAVCMSPVIYHAVRSVKIVPKVTVERDSARMEAIWLKDTIQVETIWLIDTLAMVAVNPRMMDTSKHQLRVQPSDRERALSSRKGNIRPRPTRLEPLLPEHEKKSEISIGTR